MCENKHSVLNDLQLDFNELSQTSWREELGSVGAMVLYNWLINP